MQAVIVAGGKGTRLRSRLGDLPKPMAPVGGKPLLEHQILLARSHGFDDVVLLLGHGHETISAWAGEGSRWGIRLRWIEEATPLGTAGSVLAAIHELDSRFLVMYGDTMLNVDLARFWRTHAERQNAISLFLHPSDHPEDSDLIETDRQNRVIAFHPYPRDPRRDYPNQVNAGLYVIERKALAAIPPPKCLLDFGKDLFPELHARGHELFGYSSPEYIKDVGTPERLDEVNADYESGRIAGASLATPLPAVFLDRDGTINREINHLRAPEQFVLLEGVAESIREWNRAGWLVVVVSNQPVIARGDCTEAVLAAIHNRMETMLGRAGAYVDRIYYCPHHPDGGFPGERPELKLRCNCRKPGTALIDDAQRELNLDLARSWLIGDSTTDIRTARNAGVRSVLVNTGHGGRDGVYPDAPDFIAAGLLEAMRLTIDISNRASR